MFIVILLRATFACFASPALHVPCYPICGLCSALLCYCTVKNGAHYQDKHHSLDTHYTSKLYSSKLYWNECEARILWWSSLTWMWDVRWQRTSSCSNNTRNLRYCWFFLHSIWQLLLQYCSMSIFRDVRSLHSYVLECCMQSNGRTRWLLFWRSHLSAWRARMLCKQSRSLCYQALSNEHHKILKLYHLLREHQRTLELVHDFMCSSVRNGRLYTDRVC